MAKYPYDLESQYSKNVVDFYKSVSKDYIKFVRQLLTDRDFRNRLNSYEIRFNIFKFQNFRERLFDIKEKIFSKKIFDKMFKSMERVFKNLDNRIVKNIKNTYKKRKFDIPELELKTDSEMLKQSVERNVNLIRGIAEKQIDNLETTVLNGVTGGDSFDNIVNEVLKQSDKGIAYADFVARDQTAKVFSEVNQERQRSSGFDNYKWQATTGDWNNVRDAHKAVHGKIYSWSDPPLVGGRNLHPGEDYQCRCTAIPVFE